jgi:hypothetical protein
MYPAASSSSISIPEGISSGPTHISVRLRRLRAQKNVHMSAYVCPFSSGALPPAAGTHLFDRMRD